MYQRILTYIITLLFTVVFIAPRIVNLHVLSHLSDENDTPISCELCDVLIYTSQLDLAKDDVSYFENTSQNLSGLFVVVPQYNTPQEKIVSPTFIYNKPPPLL
ncbi:hypothetical protein [Aquimarina algicola]|uniref:DUF2946 domain-containing protein n=1 Tax=Aquimarina algicola TaxID=2589995 RepID=A0A504JFZ1_9FLAO|nr:hypothetical protein [Aquimarina algicola]TPN87375.1 hypothetical protein FHK87_07250 [Aquimarina algicola]